MEIYIKTLGCKLNFAESSAIGKDLIDHGHTLTDDIQLAKVCVVNTCSVTDTADSKDRQFIHHAKKLNPDIKIIAVTSMPDPAFLKKARAVGVDSFWYKEVEAEPLLWVMDRTLAGESVWPDEPPEIHLGQASSKDFTERELEVLRLLSEGLTDREIASRLYLSLPAVRYHVGNLISKTGLSSRTELAVRAVSSGLIIPANV